MIRPRGTTILGSLLCGGSLAHMWTHGQWGQEDWGVVALVTLGAGLMFTREVTALITAWRRRTGEHRRDS